MSKFMQKPIIIDAWQWLGVLDGMPSKIAACTQDRAGSESLFVATLEGVMEAKLGDWIITGIKNEIYPCKPDIFKATHEPIMLSGL